MRRVMKYIKPETTVVKADGVVLLSGSLVEVGKADPTKSLGSEDDGNIVMAKRHHYGFDDSLDDSWNPDDDYLW